MTQLPRPNLYPTGVVQTAYGRCLDFESRSVGAAPMLSSPPPLICARLLGYMIREAPTPNGCFIFSTEVISCADDAALVQLAKLYIDHLLCCFKSAKGRTPAPSSHPSRPSFDDVQESLKHLLTEAPRSYQTAKKKALIRDGYRCVLTGNYDMGCYNEVTAVTQAADSGGILSSTRLAHIMPESTNAGISEDNEGGAKHEYAATVWAVMARFGEVFVPDELTGSKFHRLENVLTMDTSKHDMFDSLMIWLEETPTPNRYQMNAVAPPYLAGIPAFVTLTSANTDLPLPSPAYLRLHATCARVAHLSGAGEYVTKVLRDLEEIRVLAKDGSSADVLNYALSKRGSVH